MLINFLKYSILSLLLSSNPNEMNIVETAVSNDNFSTLVAAVKAGDLVDALSSEGPFTVFAPTNDGFNKLPEGTLGTLLKPENKGTLQSILKYHVVAGKFMAGDVVKAINENGGEFAVKTLQGNELTLKLWEGSVYVIDTNGNKAKVVIADVDTSNGVIHAIDNVVIPE
ncbi:MAG: fasciclin domain-containing protein [Flavobacteriaceae bacterium]|nr:fasciclin domain-containing protein [Flavobacteriaceae bacterium]